MARERVVAMAAAAAIVTVAMVPVSGAPAWPREDKHAETAHTGLLSRRTE